MHEPLLGDVITTVCIIEISNPILYFQFCFGLKLASLTVGS